MHIALRCEKVGKENTKRLNACLQYVTNRKGTTALSHTSSQTIEDKRPETCFSLVYGGVQIHVLMDLYSESVL